MTAVEVLNFGGGFHSISYEVMMKKRTALTIFLCACMSFGGCELPFNFGESIGAGTSLSGNSSSSSVDFAGENSSEEIGGGNSSEEIGGGNSSEVVTSDEMSIHFLQLGNKNSGDCTLIKVGDTEVLIDAGSTDGSAATIVPYISQYCTDGTLEYVIATHGDADHISAFVGNDTSKGIFDSFDCGVIIDFAKTTKTTQTYNKYVTLREAEVAQGAQHYTALQCWNNADGAQRSYALGEDITLNILYQKYYEEKTSTENNYSVCTLISQGDKHFLFTGDLESAGEQSLVQSNDLPKCTLFKAGHHGSNTSNTATLLSKIQPEIVVISCCCGDKYNFPHQETINTVARYTEQVYVPVVATASGYALMNGNIVVTSKTDGVSVQGSNNSTLFKDTDWFKNNRTTPNAWKITGE